MTEEGRQPSMIWLFFSPSGRIGRLPFFLSWLFWLFTGGLLLAQVLKYEGQDAPLALWTLALIASGFVSTVSLVMLSMGAGTGCDAQYLFAEDVLGTNRGHMPRHSKVYRNFAAEYDRLQQERIAAFKEYVADVESKAYPEEKHIVRMAPDELKTFLDELDRG